MPIPTWSCPTARLLIGHSIETAIGIIADTPATAADIGDKFAGFIGTGSVGAFDVVIGFGSEPIPLLFWPPAEA